MSYDPKPATANTNELAQSVELRAEAENRALQDFNAAVGKEITIRFLTGYNEHEDSVDVDGISIRVRVEDTKNVSLDHWVGEYLDPYWDVTPIGEYPELVDLRSFWTYGPSYRVVDGKLEAVDNNQSLLRSELPHICPLCGKVIGDEWNKCLCLHEDDGNYAGEDEFGR